MTNLPISIGARVRIIHAMPYPSGLTGTVVAKVDRYESHFPWHVELDGQHGRSCFHPSEIEVITEEVSV